LSMRALLLLLFEIVRDPKSLYICCYDSNVGKNTQQ